MNIIGEILAILIIAYPVGALAFLCHWANQNIKKGERGGAI